MNPFALVNIFSSMICASLGIFSLRLGPRAPLNRLSLAICMCFSLWGFAFAFMHAADSPGEISFWYAVSAPGWCLYGAIALHYVMVLAGRRSFLMKKRAYLILYGPGVAFTIAQALTGFYASGFVRTGYGLLEVPNTDGIWFWLFILYQTGYSLYGIVLIHLWGKRATAQREKKQSGALVLSASVGLLLAFITDILMPAMGIFLLPALSPLFILIWAYGIWYSITRYRFLSMNLADVSDEVVKRMQDLLMLVDPDGAIVRTNPQALKLLGYDERTIVGKKFFELLLDSRAASGGFTALIRNKSPRIEMMNSFITGAGERIPAAISASTIVDEFNDVIGAVIIGNDLREKLLLQKEIGERANAEAVLTMKNDAMERDLRSAERIQKALLPHSPPDCRRMKIDFRNHSVAAIGGDYFSFTDFGPGGMGVFICDVSGHGVSAALFLSLVKFLFDRICRSCGDSPRAFLEELNRDLAINMQNHFLTAVYGIFSFPEGTDEAEFTFSRGGHPNPIVHWAGSGQVELLQCGGTVLGRFRDPIYRQERVRLGKHDRVYLYTDGVIETRNPGKDFFGINGLVSVIREMGTASLADTLDAVTGAMTKFRAGGPVEDDTVIIGVEIIRKY